MKILFSPSESKSNLENYKQYINKTSFCCSELYDTRYEVIKKYQSLTTNANLQTLKKIFGIKDEQKCLEFAQRDITKSFTCKTVQRYNGVGYKYLDYNSLSKSRKDFIDNNVIIFSNLFGPILAKDTIPNYKLKQGFNFENFKIDEFYNKNFSYKLDKLLEGELIIDLRAGFYEKFYKIKEPYITMKFNKKGKTVSHWAKAYRGLILRELSKYQPLNKNDFDLIEFKNLKNTEIIERNEKTEYIFEILE